MKKHEHKYTYEVHFTMNKEVFYSDQPIDDFLEALNSSNGAMNQRGERIFLATPVRVTYIKQIDNEKDFRF